MNRRQYSAAQTVRKLLTPGLAISGDSDSWMNLHTHPAMIGYDPGGVHRECPRWANGWPSSEVASQTGRALLNLRERLVRGDRARGADLGTALEELAQGLSRTPIRLALDCLAYPGLLDVSAGGGFVVKEFTLADILGRHRSARCTGGHGGAPRSGRAHSRSYWTGYAA